MAKRQQARHKELYDRKCRGAELEVGDLVLVKQTAWKGRHKIQDRWEDEEYQVVDQPTPGVPIYTVKCIARGRPRVLHRNLLQPLQGRIRQEGGVGERVAEDETPKVARTPCERPRRTTKPHVSPIQQVDTSVVLSDENTHSMLTSPPSPESGDEDSSQDEEYITPIPSNTTASGSATTDIPPSTDGNIQLVSDVPYPEESIPLD